MQKKKVHNISYFAHLENINEGWERVRSGSEPFPFRLRRVFSTASRWRPAADDSCPGGFDPADVSTASVRSNQQAGLPVGKDTAGL